MTTTTNSTFDLVCVPGAIAPSELAAHFELGRRLFAERAEERIELPSGIALRLAGDDFPQVARFVANERKCCPFLYIEVDIAPGGGPMWLRLSGPRGTRELIEAELGLTTAAGSCDATNSIGSHNTCNAKLQPPSAAVSDLRRSASRRARRRAIRALIRASARRSVRHETHQTD